MGAQLATPSSHSPRDRGHTVDLGGGQLLEVTAIASPQTTALGVQMDSRESFAAHRRAAILKAGGRHRAQVAKLASSGPAHQHLRTSAVRSRPLCFTDRALGATP